MNDKFVSRKQNRLSGFDYSSVGSYFVTVCTSVRGNMFWKNVGATIGRPNNIRLSPIGKIVDESINKIPEIYPLVTVDHYVIMPDHIHLLISIHPNKEGRPMVAPTLSRIIKQMKGYVTKKTGASIWQKLFFEHVIRNRYDYDEHVQYIYGNPLRKIYGN